MSLFGRILPGLVSNLQRCNPFVLQANMFHSLTAAAANDTAQAGGLFTTFIRTNIRNHFPRPSERKRIKRHGWKLRMSTEAGRRTLMRRILKGRHVYSH